MSLATGRIAAHQWRELRTLRLEALRTDPEAFGDTFAEAVRRPDEYWRGKAARDASSPMSGMFVAPDPRQERPERLVAMAGAFIVEAEPEIAWVMSVYVTPEFRGAADGAGRAVMDATVEWLRGTGAEAVRLKVFEDNARAVAFYRRLGFVEIERTDGPAENDPRKLAVMHLESFERPDGPAAG